MNNKIVGRRPGMTDEEIGEAISFVNAIGKLNNEELRKRDLAIGEPKLISHFLTAVRSGQSTMLPEQAVTLLRLTPILLPKGSHTVHNAILTAGPKVQKLYEEAKTLEEKRRLAEIMKMAGYTCMSRKLASISRDLRQREFDLFKPFIGDTQAYKTAYERYTARKASGRSISFAEAVDVYTVAIPGARRYGHLRE